jgi:sugar phosphate isomerase/epimerase
LLPTSQITDSAGEDLAESLGRLRPRLAYVQIKDGTGQGDAWRLTDLGAGDVPLAWTFERLLAGGYRGAFSVEWERVWHPHLAPAEVALPRALRMVQAWRAAGSAAVAAANNQ